MKLSSDGFCEQGRRGGTNQDAAGIFMEESQGLFFVADGMGGYSQGERASKTVKQALAGWWDRRLNLPVQPDFVATVGELKAILCQANQEVWEETDKSQVCGTTVVLLWIGQQDYALLWCGDSRCYMTDQRLLGGAVRQLTRDDVWKPEAAQPAANHPNEGKLLRALGADKNFICNVKTGKLLHHTLFALCSDGVYKYVGKGKLTAGLKWAVLGGTIEKTLESIRQEVYQNGAPDNLSCILVRCVK